MAWPIGAIHRPYSSPMLVWTPDPLATKGLGSRLLSCSDIYTHQQLQIQQCVPHCSRSDCDREHPRLLTDGSEICIIDCPQGFHLFSYLGMSVNDFCCSHILTITLNEQSTYLGHNCSVSCLIPRSKYALGTRLWSSADRIRLWLCDNRLQHGASANLFSARCSLASARCVPYRFIRL